MATVPNLPLSLAQVRAVFGAPAGTPLHSFHRGGPWVPNIAANNNVPTSGPIRLAQLVGATNYQAIVLSGPTTYNFGTLFNQTPPPTRVRAPGITMTGGNGSAVAHWTELTHDSHIDCNNTGSVGTTFSAFAEVSDGDTGTFVSKWRLSVSDGVTSDTLDLTLSVTLVNP